MVQERGLKMYFNTLQILLYKYYFGKDTKYYFTMLIYNVYNYNIYCDWLILVQLIPNNSAKICYHLSQCKNLLSVAP